MSPLKHSKSFAARMGRWSASHWKTATFGWLAFVIVVVRHGHRRAHADDRARRTLLSARPARPTRSSTTRSTSTKNGQGELVVIQSKTKTVDDPAFRATIDDTSARSRASSRSTSCTRRWPPGTRVRSRPTATRH